MTWICAACGAEHEQNKPPCRQCANEQFAKVPEQNTPPAVESSANIEWQCKECGRWHMRNNPPCNQCGNMSLEAAIVESETASSGSAREESDFAPAVPKRITFATVFSYLYGLPIAILGLLNLSDSLLGGASLFLAGAIALPTFRTRLRKQWHVEFSGGGILAISVVFWVIALWLLNGS